MNPKKTSVSLEDLLRVKRAEKPPEEFWSKFERELRMKQLAAIVEPRPWWAPLIRVGARVSRHQLPLGAVAILAVSFVTLHEYRLGDARPGIDSDVRMPELAMAVPAESALPAAPAPVRAAAADTQVMADDSAETEEAAVQPATEVGRASHTVALQSTAPAEPSPSARYIAANLAAAQAADPQIIDEAFGTRVRRVAVAEPVRDPLVQSASLADTRRSRLLTTALPASSNNGEVAVGSSARVVRRLTEDRLYDTISRIGVQADRVAIKF